MRTYLKITTLSPLHIGAGEDFIPTGYIIDREMLYEFDETDFYHELSSMDKRGLLTAADQGLHALKNFYESHKELAKRISYRQIPVSREIANRYRKQYNKDGSLNNNRLEIAKTVYQGASRLPYIPGSSLKGVIETAMGTYVEKGTNEERQNLQVSDFFTDEPSTVCGFAMRRHKHKEKAGKGIPVMVESVKKDTIFWGTVSSEKKGLSDQLYSIEDMLNSMETFSKNAEENMFSEFKKIAPKESHVFRIGRFVGQNFTAVNLRKSPVTHSLFTMDKTSYIPFGWIYAEIVSVEQFEDALDHYVQKSEERISSLRTLREKRERERILRQKEEEEKVRKKAEEEARRKAEAEAEAARLASLSPVDRLLEENDIPTLINMMKSGEIDNYDEIKVELARKIKERLMRDPKTWEKAKKKAADRKRFIQGILGE